MVSWIDIKRVEDLWRMLGWESSFIGSLREPTCRRMLEERKCISHLWKTLDDEFIGENSILLLKSEK